MSARSAAVRVRPRTGFIAVDQPLKVVHVEAACRHRVHPSHSGLSALSELPNDRLGPFSSRSPELPFENSGSLPGAAMRDYPSFQDTP